MPLRGGVALAEPLTRLGAVFGFNPLPAVFLLYLLGIVVAYIVTAEIAKRLFYARGAS